MTENEKKFVESIVNFDSNVLKAQQYIKENYSIDSTFDDDTCEIHLTCENAENALMLAAAKEYITETLEDSVICIFG